MFCAFKPQNHISVSGRNVGGLVILQNMDIRWPNWTIFIEMIISIWFIESNGKTASSLKCEG